MTRIVVALLLPLLAACSERWEGFAYPDRNDLTRHYLAGEHKTLDSCRAASLALLRRLNSFQGDYECGLNCRSGGSLPGLKICERTER